MIDLAPPLRHARRASALPAVAQERIDEAAAPGDVPPLSMDSTPAAFRAMRQPGADRVQAQGRPARRPPQAACPSPAAAAPFPSTSSLPTTATLAALAHQLAADPAIEPQSEAFRHLLLTRLRAAWPDAGAPQIAAAAVEIRLQLIGRTACSADASSTGA